jgi:uncharacterized protein YutE (UPF0331/DUF86 family)/predicted nucleotidyltransferase
MAKFLKSKEFVLLKKYFEKEPSVLLAFLFGSFASGRETEESDYDIAVYLKEKERRKRIKIWLALQRILEREVNLVLLDEAPATLVANVFYSGIPLSIKDKKLYWELYLSKTAEAEDFLRFLEDFWRIYKSSKSLIPPEKAVLLERIQFIDRELREIEEFKKIKLEEYTGSSIKRRNMDRWCETIINATIDIAKIILASEKRKAPKTYGDVLYQFGILIGLTEKEAEYFSELADLRNILAHEYLEVLYGRIKDFIKEFPKLYPKIFKFLKEYLR